MESFSLENKKHREEQKMLGWIDKCPAYLENIPQMTMKFKSVVNFTFFPALTIPFLLSKQPFKKKF